MSSLPRAAWGLALLLAACGTSSNSPSKDGGKEGSSLCTPGKQVSCACAGGGQGVQVCNSEGTGYGPCHCMTDGGHRVDSGKDSGHDATMSDSGAGDSGSKDSGGEGACDCGTESGHDSGDAPSDTEMKDTSSGDSGTCVLEAGADAGPGGTLNWAENFGKTGYAYPASVAIDPTSGELVATGYFYGTTNFGGGVLASVGDSSSAQSIFVAKFDTGGGFNWAKAFGNGANPSGNNIAVDLSGNVVVAGYLIGTLDFGCGSMTATGTDDIFVVSLSSAGACSWSKHFGVAAQSQNIDSLALDGSGNIVIGGVAFGGLDFGGGPLTGYFMAEFTSAGVYSWSKAITASSTTSSPSLAVDPSGNVVLAGSFSGSADFGGGVLSSGPGSAAFVAQYDGTGTYLWANEYPGVVESGVGGSDVNNGGVAADSCGNIFVTGSFFGSLDFGLGASLSATDTTKFYLFLAKIDSSGTGVWAKEFVGSGGAFYPGTIAVSGAGGPTMAGTLTGTTDFGGGALSSVGLHSVYVASFDALGGYRWSYAGGPPSTANESAAPGFGDVAADGTRVVLFGDFGTCSGACMTSPGGTTLTLAGKTLTAVSAGDLFLASFSP